MHMGKDEVVLVNLDAYTGSPDYIVDALEELGVNVGEKIDIGLI